MKSKIDTIDWVFKWLALVAAVFAAIVVSGCHIAWGCCTLWIISNIFQKFTIQRLEQDCVDLIKENHVLNDEIDNIRRKK